MSRPLTDDLDRPVELAAPPRRIVSLVPSLTELVCALGAEDRLIGVTTYCTDPPAVVASLPKFGGTKDPDMAAIRDSRPDLVLMNSEENRAEDFDRCTALGLAVFVSFPRTVQETAMSIERLGRVLDAAPRAALLANEVSAAGQGTEGRRQRIFCPIWRKPWMSFNRDTYADDLLRCAGGDNVCAAMDDRYPVVDLARVAEAEPEIVLLPDEPYPFRDRHRLLLHELAESPALRDGRVYLIDGRMLFWYGARTAPAVRELRALIRRS